MASSPKRNEGSSFALFHPYRSENQQAVDKEKLTKKISQISDNMVVSPSANSDSGATAELSDHLHVDRLSNSHNLTDGDIDNFAIKTPQQIKAAITQTATEIGQLLESIRLATICIPSYGSAQSKDEFYEMHDKSVKLIRENDVRINNLIGLYDHMFGLWKESEQIQFSECFNKRIISLLQEQLKNDPERLDRLQFRKIDDLISEVD